MFVAMAGLHGCMPNCSEDYTDYNAAVDSMAELHDLSEEQKETLRNDGIIELDIHVQGNEYIEIVPIAW